MTIEPLGEGIVCRCEGDEEENERYEVVVGGQDIKGRIYKNPGRRRTSCAPHFEWR